MKENPWPLWSEKLRAIAQNGITYTDGEFDLERYHQLQAISHEMTAHLTGAPIEKVSNYFLPDKNYCTPKVDLRAGVFKNDHILLVKEREDGRWSLPGGWADVCESPSSGAEREVLEESGYLVKAYKVVAIRDVLKHPYSPRNPHHLLKIIFLCELQGGKAKKNIEISDVNFFPVGNIPPLSLGRTLHDDISLLYKHHQTPSLATVYD